MQLISRLFIAWLLLGAVVLTAEEQPLLEEDGSILGADLLEGTVPADQGTGLSFDSEKRQKLQVKLLLYNQSDNGGIQEVDEDASIYETVIVYSNKITDKDTLTLRLLGDVVSSASIKREHNAQYRSLQSGASGTVYGNINVGWQRQQENWKYKVNAGFGTEYAYRSINLGIGAIGELNEKNTTVSFNLQTFADTVRMIRFDGTQDPSESRDSINVELGVTQLLTPRSLISGTWYHSSQSGFLATQFNSVFISGVEDFENLPDRRERDSLTIRYKQAVNRDMAWEAGFRYYTDDWGIDSETLDLKYFQYVLDRSILMEYNYRFYVQSEADHYQESFTSAQQYQTSDPDLGDFTGHMFGVKSTFKDRVIMGQMGEWDIGVNYYTRDNGLDMVWITTGFKIEF